MNHEEFVRNQREMYYDRKHDAALQVVAEAAATGGGGGGDLGGDLGGDIGGDLGGDLDADLGGPEEIPAGDVGGDEPAADTGGDDSPLLAVPPGSRNAPRLTPGAKGKVYHPVKTDSRPSGARTRNYASIASPETNTYRTNNLGGSELRSLARGIYEHDESTYSLEDKNQEKQILEVNQSIVNLWMF